MKAVRWAAAAVAALGFGTAGWWSIRNAWADYQAGLETVAGTGKALAAMPEKGEYYARLAMLAADADPQRAAWALHKAVNLNPWDAAGWIELGLREERAGSLPEAERDLLRAAEVDRKYLPRWTLANYYFRRDDTARFWVWAKDAAEMAYGDSTPLFRLCGRVAEDGRLTERLGIGDPALRAQYLRYLLDAGKAELSADAASRVAESAREADIPLAMEACGLLIEVRQATAAAEIWNRLARSGRLAAGEVKTGQVTNGRFASAPTGLGFDWRLPGGEEIGAAGEENPPGLRLTFSGRQAENVEALVQFAPVAGNAAYVLKFGYRTSGIGARAGLAWRASGLDGANLGVGGELSSEADREGDLAFRTPPGCAVVRIALEYHRRPGTTRIDGFVVLHEARLETTHSPDVPEPRSRIR